MFKRSGKFVVRACPGSGKTYSVAARLAWKIENWEYKNRGIATLSFTNVAWQEIKNKLVKEFNVNRQLGHPHFLGTIDSFVNQYIFLPFGHLVMDCKKRPILVGEPHGSWNSAKYDKDYDGYFEFVSYGLDEKLIFPEVPGLFHFGYNKFYKKDGGESGHAKNIRKTKTKYWARGYATQRDANYFAMTILEKYNSIAKALVNRFQMLIIDEAQDTTEIQMRIIDLLLKNGLKEIMLVGDPDQAIYEWNAARPDLFNSKYEVWKDNSVELNENRRSSQKICNFTSRLTKSYSFEPYKAVDKSIKDFSFSPEIRIYNENEVKVVIDEFMSICKHNGIDISKENVAVLYRGKNFISFIDNANEQNRENKNSKNFAPWKIGDSITKDIVGGKYLCDKGDFKNGFKIIEKAVIKALINKNYCTQQDIKNRVEERGFINHRLECYKIFKELPDTDMKLRDWVEQANNNFNNSNIKITLQIEQSKGNVKISELFPKEEAVLFDKKYRLGTVHSVKGETFEAILLFLKQKGIKGEWYKTLLANGKTTIDNEELRIVYVGTTRPRKILILAVPSEEDKKAWDERLIH